MQGEINYDQLQDIDPSYIDFDTFDLKQRIEKPYVLKECQHPRNCHPFSDAIQSWKNEGVIRCNYCKKETKIFADVRRDVRWQAYQQFHQSVETVQIIQGLLVHKYTRKKRFVDLITKYSTDNRSEEEKKVKIFDGMKDFLINLRKRFHSGNSISSIIQQQNQNQEKILFWAYCLLDKVKITIPIRIIKCDHLECYELTSLLAHYQQQQMKQENINVLSSNNGKTPVQDKKIIFQCYHPGCTNTLNITKFQDLIQGIMIDLNLLRVINKGMPAQFKFVYFPKSKQFEVEQENQIQIDPIIEKYYNTYLTQAEKTQIQLQQFQSQIQNMVTPVMQGEYPIHIEKQMQSDMYRTKTINMIDPLTKNFIEFPVRCIQCQDLQKCMDVRSFVAQHLLAKLQKKIMNKCPLCSKDYKTQTLPANIIYFDQNLISKMFKDMSYYQTKEFKYDGKQYMREQFISRQKISKDIYLLNLLNENGNQIGEFNLQLCTADANKIIETPLMLKDCPEKSLIDFDTFYKKMEEANFNIEEKGITLCFCKKCNQHPIKSYTQSVYYHEAYGEALIQLKKKSSAKITSFKYNFETQEIILKLGKDSGSLDKKLRGMAQLERGFLEMMGDDEYDEYFKPKLIQGRKFQIIKMEQKDIIDGLHIVHDKKGISVNLQEQMDSMNKNANPTLKQFKFQVSNISVELNNEDIRPNVGNFCLKK